MKGVKGKFKTSSALVREGVWFDVAENTDGSKCRVRLRRSGRGNPQWAVSFREHTKGLDMEAVSPEEDELITANVFAEANVVDWENFQPEDDGQNMPFSVENAKMILTDPDWVELLKDWQTKANGIAAFQQKREDEAGN